MLVKLEKYETMPNNTHSYTLEQVQKLIKNEHPHLIINNINGYKVYDNKLNVNANIEAELLGSKIKDFNTIIEIPLKMNKN